MPIDFSAPTTKNVVEIPGYVRPEVPVEHYEEEFSTERGCEEAFRKKYVGWLYGPNMTREDEDEANKTPHYRLAEYVVAKMFGVRPEPRNRTGYDIDTRGLLLGGKEYGRIEQKTYSLRNNYQVINGVCRDRWRADVLSEDNVLSKRGKCDYVFACIWDHFDQQFYWFRIPAEAAFANKSLVLGRGVRGGYGKWEKYRWVGPENE